MTQIPAKIDFSQTAINKAVRGEIMKNPVTTWLSIGGVGIGAALFIVHAPLLITIGATGLVLFGVSKLVWDYGMRKDYFAKKYVEALHKALLAQNEAKTTRIGTDLEALGCTQGVKQLDKLKKEIANLERVIRQRFHEGELTYARYLGTAQQVYLGAIDRLGEIAIALQSIQTIDIADVTKCIKELRGDNIPDEKQETEITALEERQSLHIEQTEKAEKLLGENEAALTMLSKTAASLANTQTEKGRATMDMESAMEELRSLASKAGMYATKQ